MYPGWKQSWKDDEVIGWEFEKDPRWYVKMHEFNSTAVDGNTNQLMVWTIGFLVGNVRIEITFGGPVTDKKSAGKYRSFVIGAMKIIAQGGDVYEVFGNIVKLAEEMGVWVSKVPPNPSDVPEKFGERIRSNE